MAGVATTAATPASTRHATIACPVCDGTEFTPLFHKDNEVLVTCSGCRLVLVNPPPDHARITANYDSGYTQGYLRKREKKLRRARRWVRRIRAGYVPRGRWLDIGCSAGFVLHCAREAGYEVWGVDIEPAAVDFARRQFGLAQVVAGTLEECGFPAARFDVITAYEVIEHVPDVKRLVREIARLLAPGGIVEIRTPDAGHWRVRNRLQEWEAVRPTEHLYYFSRATLGRLLEKHGLEIVRSRFSLKPGLKIYATRAGST